MSPCRRGEINEVLQLRRDVHVAHDDTLDPTRLGLELVSLKSQQRIDAFAHPDRVFYQL